MGNKLFTSKQKENTIIVEGLFNAGKQTILEKLKIGEVAIVPTIGRPVMTGSFENYKFNSIDIGGRCSMRPLRRHYYQNCCAYVFVVDSSGNYNFPEAKYELQQSLKEENLKDAVFLVLANKQDVPGAANVQEMIEELGLRDDTTHTCNIFGTCATTGEGLFEAMSWLSEALNGVEEQPKVEVSTTKPASHSKSGPLAYLRKITASLKTACAH